MATLIGVRGFALEDEEDTPTASLADVQYRPSSGVGYDCFRPIADVNARNKFAALLPF